MAYVVARIYSFGDEALPKGCSALTIDGKDVQVFRKVLRDQMQLCENRDGWWLRFFAESDYAQCFFVRFTQEDAESRPEQFRGRWPISTLAYASLQQGAGPEAVDAHALQQACRATSVLVRGSGSVGSCDLYEASTHWGHVDGRGAQYISKYDRLAQFERHVLLHVLAYAYLLTMETLGNQLSEALTLGKGEQELRDLYKKVALFQARSFFHQPVRLSNAATCEAWVRIDRALGIHAASDELFKQVESAHYIFALDEEKRAQAQQQQRAREEKRRDRLLVIAGLLLALASVPGLYDLLGAWL